MSSIKQLGLSRTGTNYLWLLLRRNFVDTSLFDRNFENKHWPLSMQENISRAIISIKNPYAFAVSIDKWRQSRERTDEPISSLFIKHQCEWYNEVYRSYLPLIAADTGYVVLYEYLLTNTDKALDGIANFFNLERNKKFVQIENTMTPEGEEMPVPFYGNYYTEHKYMSALPENIIEIIDNTICPEVREHYGYAQEEMRLTA